MAGQASLIMGWSRTILGCVLVRGVPERVGTGRGACDQAERRNRRRGWLALRQPQPFRRRNRYPVRTTPRRDLREQFLDAEIRHLDAVGLHPTNMPITPMASMTCALLVKSIFFF